MKVNRDLFPEIGKEFHLNESNLGEAEKHFHRYGMIIIKEALNHDKIARYRDSAHKFYGELKRARISNDESLLSKWKEEFSLNVVNNAVNLEAMLADGSSVADFIGMYRESLIHTLMCNIVNVDVGYNNAHRLRCYYADDKVAQYLELHQDNGHTNNHLTITVWTPMLQDGVVANRDACGIRLIPFRPPYNFGRSGPKVFKTISIEDLVRVGAIDERDVDQIDDFFIYPEVKTGDVVLFDGYVPHGTTPRAFPHDRASVDIRATPLLSLRKQ